MSDQFIVTDPKAAAALAKTRVRTILFALVEAERSLQDLNTVLGLSLSLLHYYVTRLRDLGLVRVVRFAPRAGRPIAIYRAVADSFLVPGHVSDQSPGAILRAVLETSLEFARARSPSEAIHYFLDADRRPKMRRLTTGVGPQTDGEWWWRLRLSKLDAEELSRRVRDLIAIYGAGIRTPGEYICHFALAETENR